MNRYTLIFVLTMSVLLGSSGVCWSADFQKGLDAHERGDFATALKEWTPLAKQGNAAAENMRVWRNIDMGDVIYKPVVCFTTAYYKALFRSYFS